MNQKWILFLALSALIAGCGETQTATGEPVLRPVRVALVARNNDVRQRSFTGISQSTQESRMSFKVGGTVVELPVQVGDRLQAGDLIARMNPSTYDLNVQQSEASLAQAVANQRNANADYSRAKELYENSNASRNDLDSARAAAESAQAQVRSARKTLEIAQLNRSYTRLDAAADCTVASLDVEINENVVAGSQIARVSCGAGIEVSLGVPESLIGGLRQGMAAQVRFNAIGDRLFEGTITEVGIGSSSGSATFPVVVALTDPEPGVRPSMAAEVSFEFRSTGLSAIAIPASALVNDERGTFVFVAVPDGAGQAVIERREVNAGELTADGIQILNGLAEGDQVVTAGTSVIRASQRVLLPGS
ncbi:MAG: efflux RND transporter periplasmic adaptor subunit [Gammaproteobacteria bacterium]